MTEHVENTLGDFSGGTVTDKLVHGTTFADDFQKGIDKLTITLDTIDIDDHGFSTNEDLCILYTTGVDSGSVRVDSVGGDGFMTAKHVTSGKGRTIGLEHVGTREDMMSILGSVMECVFDHIWRDIEEIRT